MTGEKKLARAVSRTFSQPEWQGEPLNGRTLYIHGEQGFGDMVQFARFIPFVAKKGDKLIVECNPSLLRLFATLDGEYQLVTTDHVDPDFDVYVSLPSLPRIFGTELETLPRVCALSAPARDKQHSYCTGSGQKAQSRNCLGR